MMILYDLHTRQRSVEIRFVNNYCYEWMWDMREREIERERENVRENEREKECEKKTE